MNIMRALWLLIRGNSQANGHSVKLFENALLYVEGRMRILVPVRINIGVVTIAYQDVGALSADRTHMLTDEKRVDVFEHITRDLEAKGYLVTIA